MLLYYCHNNTNLMSFMKNNFTIGETAKILNVSLDTLRRWDKNKTLIATRTTDGGDRYYSREAIESYLKNNLFEHGFLWATAIIGQEPFEVFYCQNSSIFQARLSSMERELSQLAFLKENYPLIVAITGEIGNNAFDHNIGNWPDVPGLFFGYNLKSKQIFLADRGQGILKTLKRVKPELSNDQDALTTAFTEILSGRSPESRGNGLKYVTRIIKMIPLKLLFQSGQAVINIDSVNSDIKPKIAEKKIPGCLALIKF